LFCQKKRTGRNHLVKKFAPVKTERILTDCRTEYTTWHQEAIPNHEFEKTCERHGIKHTTTKVKHPWTNSVNRKSKLISQKLVCFLMVSRRLFSCEIYVVELYPDISLISDKKHFLQSDNTFCYLHKKLLTILHLSTLSDTNYSDASLIQSLYLVNFSSR